MTTPPKAAIYTKTGDKGKTRLVTGECISKSDPRVVAYGTVDELNSFVGLWRSAFGKNNSPELEKLNQELERIQNHLFNLGSRFATTDPMIMEKLPEIDKIHIEFLEKSIDMMTAELPLLKEFILPGGHELAALMHVCRTVCRRVERESIPVYELAPETYTNDVIYLNRLSDYFFVAARIINKKLKVDDHTWKKDQ